MRFYVMEKANDRCLEVLFDALKNVKVGDGLDPETQMGPLAHERRVPTMKKFVENALQVGGKVLLGGEALERTGHYFSPTVVTELPENAMLMTEEPFGPMDTIVRFSHTDDAIRRANTPEERRVGRKWVRQSRTRWS